MVSQISSPPRTPAQAPPPQPPVSWRRLVEVGHGQQALPSRQSSPASALKANAVNGSLLGLDSMAQPALAVISPGLAVSVPSIVTHSNRPPRNSACLCQNITIYCTPKRLGPAYFKHSQPPFKFCIPASCQYKVLELCLQQRPGRGTTLGL